MVCPQVRSPPRSSLHSIIFRPTKIDQGL
jgi:hypothetical protein